MNLEHPRRAVRHDAQGRVLRYSRFSLRNTELGSHGCTWLFCLCRACKCFKHAERRAAKRSCSFGIDSTPSDLSEYGLGVGLYFKQLKYFAWIFFIMTLLHVLPAMLFWFGDGLLTSSVTVTDSLALLSLGNLGEGLSTCEQISETETFSLSCAPGSVLGRVEAYYGQPRGSCACPVTQTPAPECGGIVSGSICATIPGGSARDKFCHLETSREIRLPSNTYVPVGPCCSATLLEGRPDFSALDINATVGCDSNSAQHIFGGMCLGKDRCELRLTSLANYSWTPNSTLRTDCRLLSGTGYYDPATGKCTDNLGSAGGLENCPAAASRRMTIVGTCFATKLSLFNGAWVIQKESVSIFVSFFEFCSISIFLIAVWYLRQSEQSDGLTRVRMSAADFSVYIPSLPQGVPENHLMDDITWHFTALVRDLRQEKGLDLDDVPIDRETMVQWAAHPKGDSTMTGSSMAAGSLAAAAAAAAAAGPPKTMDDGAVGFSPAHRGGTSSFGSRLEPVRYPVVADVNFGRAQGRLLQLMIRRGNMLRRLEYQLQKIRIRKAEFMQQVKDQLNLQHTAAPRPDGGPASRTRVGDSTGLASGIDTEQLLTMWMTYVNQSERIASLRRRARGLMSDIEKLNLDIDLEEAVDRDAEDRLRARVEHGYDAEDDDTEVKASAVSSAFVTFTKTSDRALVLEAYSDSCLWRVCCLNKNRLLRTAAGTFAVRVRPAPAPSDVNFENQDVSAGSRLCRQLFTLVITLIILGVAATALYFTEDTKRELLRANPPRDCRVFTASEITNKTVAVQDQYWQFFNATSGSTGVLECYCRKILTDNPTAIFSETFEIPTLDLELVAPTDPAYADIQAAKERDEYYPGVPLTTTSRALCTAWFNSFLAVQSLIYGSAAITLAVNILVRGLISRLVSFERLGSKTDETASRAIKLFFLQFLNTGALVLILNAHVDTDFFVLRRGDHRDFDADWYASVGVALTIVMIANIFIPHLTPLLSCADGAIRRWHDRRYGCDRTITRAMTNEQLVTRMRGPEFLISERMAQIYTIVFVCLVYSTGLPILLAVCTLSMLLFWLVDFVLFVRVYRRPAPIDGSLAALFTSVLPFGAVIHLGLAMWMLTNEDIFPPSDALQNAADLTAALGAGATEVSSVFGTLADFQSLVQQYDPTGDLRVGTRVTRGHVLPQLALFVLTVVSMLLGRVVLRLAGSFLANLFCFKRLGCCMSTADLINSKAVAAQRQRRMQQAMKQREEAVDAEIYGGEGGDTVDGDDASDDISVASSGLEAAFDGAGSDVDDDDDEAEAPGGCCGCAGGGSGEELSAREARRRRRRRQKKRQRRDAERRSEMLDKESLIYRLERGEVPTYWQAIPTYVLEQIHRGDREVKPHMRVLLREAYKMRTADIEMREDAVEQVLFMVREAASLKGVFERIDVAYDKAVKEAAKRRKEAAAEQAARDEREQQASQGLQLMMSLRERLARSEERLAEQSAKRDEAKRQKAHADKRSARNNTKLEEATEELEALGHEGSVEEARRILDTVKEPAKPGCEKPEDTDMAAARGKALESQVTLDRVKREAEEAQAAVTAAKASAAKPVAAKAAGATPAAASDHGEEEHEADDGEEHDDDTSAADAIKTAEAAMVQKQKEVEAATKAVEDAKAMLELLKKHKALWDKFDEDNRERRLAEVVIKLNRVEEGLAETLLKASTAVNSAEQAIEKLKKPLSTLREDAQTARKAYLTVLKECAGKARAAKSEQEALNYERTAERIAMLDDLDAATAEGIVAVDDEDTEDDEDEAGDTVDALDSKPGPRLMGARAGAALRPPPKRKSKRSMRSMGALGSVHSFMPQSMSDADISALSVPELAAHRQSLAASYKHKLEQATTIFRQAKLGMDLQVNVSGAQFLSGVHSYSLTDAHAYRTKLGLDLKVPSWLLLGAEQFGGVPVDEAADDALVREAREGPSAEEGAALAQRIRVIPGAVAASHRAHAAGAGAAGVKEQGARV